MPYCNQYTLYHFTDFEFFASALTEGLPLAFECQQVFSSFQDSSQDYGRSQQCCSLDSLHPFCYFQVVQALYQSFGDWTMCPNYTSHNRHFHVPQIFQLPNNTELLIPLFTFFFQFYSVVHWDSKGISFVSSVFFVD